MVMPGELTRATGLPSRAFPRGMIGAVVDRREPAVPEPFMTLLGPWDGAFVALMFPRTYSMSFGSWQPVRTERERGRY